MALAFPVLAQNRALSSTASGATTLPVAVGRRPYSHLTRASQPVVFSMTRTATSGTQAPLALFGVDRTFEGSVFGFDANGRVQPGYNPVGAALNLNGVAPNGVYREKIKVSGGAGTGIGFIPILDGGSGYDPSSVPGITFANAGTAAATAVVSQDGRVVGAIVTNAGTFASNSTITIAAPTSGRQARAALIAGQVTTVNTHIPFTAHAPTTAGGAFWWAEYRDRIIACSTGVLAFAPDTGLENDNQYAEGFTVATGTHPDGTTAIGVLTLARGIPNGAEITVFRGVANLVARLPTSGAQRSQVRAGHLCYIGATAAGTTDVGAVSSYLYPIASA